MGARAEVLALVFGVLATPALAGVLPFDGAFGNPGGCVFYNTGQAPDGDDYFLLTPDSFASYGTACDFDALTATTKVGFTVKAVCQAEGGDAGPDHLQVIDHGTAGYGVKFDDMDEYGPLKACPPADLGGSSEVRL